MLIELNCFAGDVAEKKMKDPSVCFSFKFVVGNVVSSWHSQVVTNRDIACVSLLVLSSSFSLCKVTNLDLQNRSLGVVAGGGGFRTTCEGH